MPMFTMPTRSAHRAATWRSAAVSAAATSWTNHCVAAPAAVVAPSVVGAASRTVGSQWRAFEKSAMYANASAGESADSIVDT